MEIQDSLEFWRDSRRWFPNSLLDDGDSGLQSLVGIRIPWAVFQIPKLRIPDSSGKDFPDSGIQISLNGVIHWKSLGLTSFPGKGKSPGNEVALGLVQSMRSSVYTNPEFVSVLCCDRRILLRTFPRMPDANSPPGRFFLALEVGPHTKPEKSALGTRLDQTEKFAPYSCRLLLITTLVEWLHREESVNLFSLLLLYLSPRTTNLF